MPDEVAGATGSPEVWVAADDVGRVPQPIERGTAPARYLDWWQAAGPKPGCIHAATSGRWIVLAGPRDVLCPPCASQAAATGKPDTCATCAARLEPREGSLHVIGSGYVSLLVRFCERCASRTDERKRK